MFCQWSSPTKNSSASNVKGLRRKIGKRHWLQDRGGKPTSGFLHEISFGYRHRRRRRAPARTRPRQGPCRRAVRSRARHSPAVDAELWFGVENSNDPAKNAALLSRALGSLRVWPLDRAAARRYGAIAAALRRSGCEFQQNDIQTA